MSNKPNFGKRKPLSDPVNQVKSLIDLSFAAAKNMGEAMTNLSALLDQFQIPGGCDECDAYQTVPEQEPGSKVLHIFVHHDDDCPARQRMEDAQQ